MSAYRCEWPAWVDWYEASGTPTRNQTSSVFGGGYIGGLSADGSYIGFQVVVAAGTYTLSAIYTTSSSAGKFQMSFDGSDVGALTDAYSASAVYNNAYAATSIALAEGVHTVRMTSNGKNASSSNYNLYPQWFSLERTGA